MIPRLARATPDITGAAGLGEDFHTMQDPDNQVVRAYSAVFDHQLPKSKIGMAVLVAKEMVLERCPSSVTTQLRKLLEP